MFFALFFLALFGQLAAAISTYGTGLDASLLPEGAILREIDGNQVVGTRADGLFVFKTNSGGARPHWYAKSPSQWNARVGDKIMSLGQVKEDQTGKRDLVLSPATPEVLSQMTFNYHTGDPLAGLKVAGLSDPGGGSLLKAIPMVYEDENERKTLEEKILEGGSENKNKWVFAIKRMSTPTDFLEFFQVVSQLVDQTYQGPHGDVVYTLPRLDEVFATALSTKIDSFLRKLARSTESKVFFKAFQEFGYF